MKKTLEIQTGKSKLRRLIALITIILFFSCSSKKEINQVAEISCGQCKFDLEGGGCDLAVRFDDTAYYVEGFGIDDFGDAHDKKTGFCNVIRKANINGIIEKGRFKASSIKLVE